MDAVAEVKARLNIEDVISEYVQLKRAGQNYKGLSPFSSEKTPSFVVSPEKQIWHDFSSGRGGDVFTFVQEVEGLDFKGALELLARKAGVDLEQFRGGAGQRKEDKERLYEVLELAAKFYQVQFQSKPEAVQYIFKQRAFTKKTVLEFQLGYSPDNDRGLTDFLLKKDFKETEIKNAGLAVVRRGNLGDMFRGRIMVPLHDPFGRVIGFTARLLADNPNAPKYINTPATPLYDKSRHIYGLHLAKKAIRDSKFSVLVEGNLDVIASHQAGQSNVVATAGTALTEQQLTALSRLSHDVRLAFDQDRAGLAAAERAIPIASKVKVDLGIITIPGAKDPDELIRQDPKLWTAAVSKPQYAFDWLLERYAAELDLTTAQGKRKFSDILLTVVRQLGDQVEQDHYLSKIAQAADINAEALRSKLHESPKRTTRLKPTKPPESQAALSKQEQDYKRVTERLLGLALMLPGTRSYLLMVEPDMVFGKDAATVLEFLKANPAFDGNLAGAPPLQQITDYVKILSLQFEELYGTVDTLELQYEAARLRAKLVEYYVKQQKTALAAKLHNASDAEEHTFLEKAHKLDQLLKATKEQ
jgi:DNA primase